MTSRKKAVKKRAKAKAASSPQFDPNDLFTGYRGTISGLHGVGTTLVWTSEHSEEQPTAVYQFELAKENFTATALDCGSTTQLLDGETLWVAGTDNLLRRGKLGAKPSKVGDAFDARIVALTTFSGGVAVVSGASLHLVTAKGGRTTFDLGEPGRSVTSDATGKWIVVGTTRGHVVVFNDADGAFEETSKTRLHDGEVTALAFAPDELRVYSTGTDCRLLISFVRGALDTEDRGGNQMHEREVRDLVIGPDFVTEEGTRQRFYTAGLDSTIKSWPRQRGGSQRPSSQDQGVVQTTALAVVEFEGKSHLAAAGLDGTIRIFAFDEEGRVADRVTTVRDAYAQAQLALASSKPKEREAGLKELAGFGDATGLSLLSKHIQSGESDHKLQVRGVELLAGAQHHSVQAHLQGFLQHGTSDVRLAAFDGLVKVCGADDLDLLRLAAKQGEEDLGLRVVQAAAKLGSDSAVDLLRQTLDHNSIPVRLAALTALEAHFGSAPEGTLAGLASANADIRRTAIVRLQKRDLLDHVVVNARLRRLWEDGDDRARLWAFVVAAHRRPNLVKALRAADADFHRHVFELEEFGKDEKKRRKDAPAAKAFDPKKLDEEDFRPLLEATGSRSIDVCLRGARGLAALGDERSLGTLLQLSRESDSGSRVAVCKALQVLGDPRSIKRVRAMLHDDDANVRDAAFSALSALQADQPIVTAKSGLTASASDVRERAFALLVKALKKSKKQMPEGGRNLLTVALNDVVPSLRQEAFKSVLNLAPDGGGAATLRFIMGSVHADVRNECLQEAKAKPKDPLYRAVLLEFLNDSDTDNRQEAFEFALDRWPSKEHRAVLEAGLASKHLQQRVDAVVKLSERKDDLRALLVGALNDAERPVRQTALGALVQAENVELLANALGSTHLDIRVEAAKALATLGDERAMGPLHEVVQGYHDLVARDAKADDITTYTEALQAALTGVSQLGHPDSIDVVLSLLNGDAAIAQGAASVLPAVAHPSNLEKVRAVTSHPSEAVRGFAALALAYNGDASVASTVFGTAPPAHQLFAALALRNDSPERFLSFVDSSDSSISKLALALTLALELSEHTADGIPERCLSLLSANGPYIRLSAAEALEHYGDQPAFYRWVYAMLNGLKSPADGWQAEPRQLLALSRAVALGSPRFAVRAAVVLAQLMEQKSDEFDRQWKLFEDRFGDVLADLEKQANKAKASPVSEQVALAWRRLKAKVKSIVVESTTFDEALRALAFGAYVGLARQQHDSNAHHLRAAAISGLARLAAQSDRLRADAVSVLLLALGDPNGTVRERAFDNLKELGASDEVLSTEALSTGLSDMGFRGLELLASGGKGGDALLESTLLESTNGLENEAAKLLAERLGWIQVHRIGLGAASETFRSNSVRGLSKEYLASKDAAAALRDALGVRHDDVRFLAARELAKKKDVAAFDTLAEMLLQADSAVQGQAMTGFELLQDGRAPALLLDRIENDDDESADVDDLLEAAVAFGDVSIAPRLVDWIDADNHRSEAFEAALELSGFQQYQWTDDEEVTPSWEEALDPLHPEVFAQLFDLAYRIADTDMLSGLVGVAKWPAENAELDQTLSALLNFSHEHIRHRAVEISGWRLRHRGGPSEGLEAALSGKDPLDQFYAAEGLGLAGRGAGLTVLRTAVDAMDDVSLRERAILALGQLADPSTVDMLLARANDEEDVLNDAATEAIGHMSQSERADEVFATLKRQAVGGGYDAEPAFKGLRWFGTPGAWDILRTTALSDDWWVAQKCVELLRFDPDSKEVVAQVMRENDDWDVAESAAESLRHLWGPDSLEPDYLLMQACVEGLDEQEKALERLREEGDVARILDVLSKVHEDNEDELIPPLVAILLGRTPLPVADAAEMLSSDKTRTVSVAAQIVGRAGAGAAKAHGDALSAATTHAREAWQGTWSDFVANKRGTREKLTDIGERYRRLVWAAGQLHVGRKELLAAANLPDHELALGIREDAVTTLGESWFGSDGVETLVAIARGGDARLRAIAAAELERCAPAASAKLIGESVHDDVSFGRLLHALDADAAQTTLRGVVSEAAGIALPGLAALGDVEGLIAAMRDAELAETTRRGAIDALAQISTSDVADTLAAFGADEEQDEMLRKAAWRARRRVTRAVARKEAP